MLRSIIALTFVASAALFGCAVSPADNDGSTAQSESAAKVREGDCVCSGGHMNGSYCKQFGAPWTPSAGSCVWPASAGALTAEQCEATGTKHSGDGSGSDIYNLGISCSIAGPADCRAKSCPTGQHCDVFRTISGPAYVCLPDGAVC